MVDLLKRFAVLFIVFCVITSVSVNVSAFSDSAEWDDSKLYVFLEANGESNSGLCFGAVKVRYDRSVNRIYLLFMLEFNDFNDDKLSGVLMNFNNLGTIKIISDGTADYNDDVYFAELDDEIADTHSMNVLLEATVGIKSGIPEKLTMYVNVLDTNGIKSNTFSVDLTEDTDDESDNTVAASNKSSSTKTTKVKTTKTKTTKTKTTRTKKTTTQKEDEEEEDIQTVIIADTDDDVSTKNDRRNLTLGLGAAAALTALAAGCVTGIKNKKKDETKEHKD